MTDTEILDALREGRDQAAFKALYGHLPTITRLVRANSGDRDDAKDVFQDALIILHRKVREGGFTLSAGLGTYLYAVCRNLWREELRRRGKVLRGWEPVEEADGPADMAALLAREAEHSMAEKALRTLGEKCLDVLRRFYILREPMTVIASALGFAGEGAAKTRKYKCLEKARERYRDLLSRSMPVRTEHP